MNFSLAIINKIRSCIKTENLTFIFSIAVIFVLDRYSKIEILDNFNEEIFYINDFININLVWNTGIGFGLLNST